MLLDTWFQSVKTLPNYKWLKKLLNLSSHKVSTYIYLQQAAAAATAAATAAAAGTPAASMPAASTKVLLSCSCSFPTHPPIRFYVLYICLQQAPAAAAAAGMERWTGTAPCGPYVENKT